LLSMVVLKYCTRMTDQGIIDVPIQKADTAYSRVGIELNVG